jgi:hypothetical protein
MSLHRHHQSLAQSLYPSSYPTDTRFHLDTRMIWISNECLNPHLWRAARGFCPGETGQWAGHRAGNKNPQGERLFVPSFLVSLALGFAVSLSRPPFHPTARGCLRRTDYPSILKIFHLSIYHKGTCFRFLLLQPLSPLFQPRVVNLKEPSMLPPLH